MSEETAVLLILLAATLWVWQGGTGRGRFDKTVGSRLLGACLVWTFFATIVAAVTLAKGEDINQEFFIVINRGILSTFRLLGEFIGTVFLIFLWLSVPLSLDDPAGPRSSSQDVPGQRSR